MDEEDLDAERQDQRTRFERPVRARLAAATMLRDRCRQREGCDVDGAFCSVGYRYPAPNMLSYKRDRDGRDLLTVVGTHRAPGLVFMSARGRPGRFLGGIAPHTAEQCGVLPAAKATTMEKTATRSTLLSAITDAIDRPTSVPRRSAANMDDCRDRLGSAPS